MIPAERATPTPSPALPRLAGKGAGLPGWIHKLQEGAWLDLGRVQGYSLIVGTLSAIFVIWFVLMRDGAIAFGGQPLGSDFVSFKAAADLALAGHPADAYVQALHHQAQQAALGGREVGYFAFFYPPVYLLACMPLALAPYLAALGFWLTATGAAYFLILRRILPERQALLPILVFPAILVELLHGQNAFLTTALLGGALLALDRRPLLAGLLFGSLCYKPQFAMLLPLALLAGGHWRTIGTAIVTVLLLCALSVAAFGWESWAGFFAGSTLAREALEEGLVGFGKMQSLFAAIRLLGGGVPFAYLVQGLLTLAVAVATVLVWRSGAPPAVRAATLVTGSILATPFVLDYDFVLLALALAWLVRDGVDRGFRPYEKTVALAVFMLPLAARPLAMSWDLPLSPLLVGGFFLLLVWRAFPRPAPSAASLPLLSAS